MSLRHVHNVQILLQPEVADEDKIRSKKPNLWFGGIVALSVMVSLLYVISRPKLQFYDNIENNFNLANDARRSIYGPIDAVYSWVNGTDPQWLERKQMHLQACQHKYNITYTDSAVSDNRFRDHDELRYSIRSIEKYAP
ncbi:hypothetical protein THRCLA_10815 [Thraustotheca clavata]|uniref:Stealth protein CR1 conserved region 1 domain-containing protein n=1 Tax=Thraustotheca clavata TaxID=74557 RepID=A0A1V9YFU8_9STRA|nr:hypothetical protein THRCLA_10815 [Thraustotheca clavata]